MFLDYLIIPVVSIVFGVLSMQRLVEDPHARIDRTRILGIQFWVVIFTALELQNLRESNGRPSPISFSPSPCFRHSIFWWWIRSLHLSDKAEWRGPSI